MNLYKLFNLEAKKDQGKLILILSLIFLTALGIAWLSPLKIVGLLVGIVLLILALIRPLGIVFLLAIYTPLEPFLLKFVPDEIYVFARYFGEFLIYIILIQLVIKLALKKIKPVRTPLNLPFTLFGAVALASIVLNLVPLSAGLLGLRMLLRYILMFFIIAWLRPPKKFIKILVYMMLALVLLESFLGLTQGIIGYPLDNLLLPSQERFYSGVSLTSGTEQIWAFGQRVFATMGRYDQLGTFLAFWLLIIVGLLYQKYFKERVFVFLMVVLGIITLALTYSRSSWFGFLLGLFVIGYLIKKDKKVFLFYGLVILFVVLYLLVSPVIISELVDQPQATFTERFFEAFSRRRWVGEYYGLGRLYFIVKTPLVVVASSPIWGVGPGQYGGGTVRALGNSMVYSKLGLPFGIWGTEGHIDNNWMSIWGETGTLGLIFYIWMLVALLRMSYRIYQKTDDKFTQGLALGYAGAIVAVSLNAFLATFFEIRTLALYLWMMGGMVWVLGQNNLKLKMQN